MPWSNFAHLTTSLLSSDDIGLKGPGKIVHSAPSNTQLLPLKLELGNGHSSAEAPSEVTSFATTQQTKARQYEIDPEFWLPPWVRDHVDSNGKPDDLIQKVIAQVNQSPNEKTFLEAQATLNELSRTTEGADLVRKSVTKDVISKTLQGGR